MRIVGLIMFLLGTIGTGFAVREAFRRGRPLDVVFGLVAPVAVIVAITGLVLIFVPGFLA